MTSSMMDHNCSTASPGAEMPGYHHASTALHHEASSSLTGALCGSRTLDASISNHCGLTPSMLTAIRYTVTTVSSSPHFGPDSNSMGPVEPGGDFLNIVVSNAGPSDCDPGECHSCCTRVGGIRCFRTEVVTQRFALRIYTCRR